jgi:hypothetical protein
MNLGSYSQVGGCWPWRQFFHSDGSGMHLQQSQLAGECCDFSGNRAARAKTADHQTGD